MAAKSRIGMAAGALLALCAWMAGDAGPSSARAAVTLYDGSLGTAPAAQGWASVGFGTFTESVGGGAVTLDTMVSDGTQIGYGRADRVFDSAAGVEVSFTAQVLAERHASPNRAGFSVIMLDSYQRGVELGFWQDRVFAQNAGFTRGEEILASTGALIEYRLRLSGSGYRLALGNGSFLQGPLRDYSCLGLLCSVYDTPNFLFFGDDTTSAAASFRLASVTVAAVPEPSQALMMGVGLVLVVARLVRRRRTS